MGRIEYREWVWRVGGFFEWNEVGGVELGVIGMGMEESIGKDFWSKEEK